MKPKLACIHTSLVFLTRETLVLDLLSRHLPDWQVVHLADDALLSDLLEKRNSPENIQRRMNLLFEAAELGGAEGIFSLCSSLGPTVPEAASRVKIPVVRIDEAMAMEAGEKGPRVTVLATVPTTLAPTSALIEEKAANAGHAGLQVRQQLVDGAFDKLMCGLAAEHDEAVYAAAEAAAPRSDCIVFAQASMTRLGEEAQRRSGVPVLTSPLSGVKLLWDSLANRG